jgi:NADPH:quinone reductase-like Zn-dependent oxidoreductase
VAAMRPPAGAAGQQSSAPVTTMKAIVQHRYGPPDVLTLEETGIPAMGDDDVLIRVHAAGVSYPDGVITRGIPYIVRLFAGLRRPRQGIRGSEVAGTVTETGANVTDLRPGDEARSAPSTPGLVTGRDGLVKWPRRRLGGAGRLTGLTRHQGELRSRAVVSEAARIVR